MMKHIQLFKFQVLLLFLIGGWSSYSQDKSNDFKYYNVNIHEFDAIKYESEMFTKNKIAKKFKIPINFLTKDSLSIRENVMINSIIGKAQIVKFYNSKTILIIDNNLKDITTIDDELIQVLYVLDLEAFLAFYSSKPNDNFPEVNTLKLNVRNDKDDLDIEKLAKVIDENKGILARYLDNQ